MPEIYIEQDIVSAARIVLPSGVADTVLLRFVFPGRGLLLAGGTPFNIHSALFCGILVPGDEALQTDTNDNRADFRGPYSA